MSVQFYKIISDVTGNMFNVKIYIGMHHRIIIGNYRKNCLKISVYVEEDDRIHAELDSLGYDEDCIVSGSMTHGDGTKDLLRTAREFIRRQYDFVIAFTYKDTSFTDCNNNIKIELMYPSICKYKTNWYSHNFGGTILSESGQLILDHLNKFLDTQITIPYEEFIETISSVKPINTELFYSALNFILPIYEKFFNLKKTYREFITYIYRHDCFYLYHWLIPFLKNVNKDYLKLPSHIWIIPIQHTTYNMEYLEINEHEYLIGGGFAEDYVI